MPDHFTSKELRCPCCGLVNFDGAARAMFNEAREIAGLPFVITSACRCDKHNAEEGGKPESSHLITEEKPATAMDIRVRNSRERFLILGGLIGAGFTRIGIGKNFIHADADPTKDPQVVWLY